jgi:hypothetical protein
VSVPTGSEAANEAGEETEEEGVEEGVEEGPPVDIDGDIYRGRGGELPSAYLVVSANYKRLWNMDAKSARAWGLLKQPDKQKLPSSSRLTGNRHLTGRIRFESRGFCRCWS